MDRYKYDLKPRLEIPRLKTVKELLADELRFIPTGPKGSELSILRRNIAYQMQLLQFLIETYQHYNVYAAVESSVYRVAVITAGNLYENLLYVSCIIKKIEEVRQIRGFYPKLQLAHKNKIISDNLREELNAIYKIRNTLHPQEQEDLDLYEFNQGVADRAGSALNDLLEELLINFGVAKPYEKPGVLKICEFCQAQVMYDFCQNCGAVVM